METVIVSLICIALMVVGGMTMSQGFLSSVDTSMVGWEDMGETNEEIMRTQLSILSTDNPKPRDILEVTLSNSGQIKTTDFVKWDVVVQYYDDGGGYYVRWLPYTEGTPVNNEWTVGGIYVDAEDETPEAFEPGILNPGEEMVIQATLNPPTGSETTNMVVVSTPNGVSTSAPFTGAK